jgi:hypothetical protein
MAGLKEIMSGDTLCTQSMLSNKTILAVRMDE